MAINLEIVDMEQMFLTASHPPVIVNEFNVSTTEDMERLNRQIYVRYEGDSLDVLPSCECGELRGEFNVDLTCQSCGTMVMSVTERPVESILWLAPPKEVSTYLNPLVWAVFSDYLTYSAGINLLEYLVNPTYLLPPHPSKQVRRLVSLLEERQMERGINYFHSHFDEVMSMLFDQGIIKGTRDSKRDLMQFITMYRDRLFTRYLPIPSKLGFITEKTITGTFADETMKPAIDAIRTISATENPPYPLSLRMRQSRAMRANALLAEYHMSFVTNQLSKKRGLLRKQVFGSRGHMTLRAVISSLSDNHRYDECYLPWSASVMTYRLHLVSKLIKRGYTPSQAHRLINGNTLKYHPLLDELFQELINESPYGGLPVLIGRNPTLMRGSIQLFHCTKIKTNPAINTISMSVLTLVAPNAD